MDHIAQCVFPRLNIAQYLADPAYRANTNSLVDIGVGGFCVFGGTSESVPKVLGDLQFQARTPLLFCADFEHGLPMRLHEGGTDFPHHLSLARASSKKPDERFTYRVAQAIAKEARSVGILWNLAPVCDINTNPENPVINIRSFGSQYETVMQNAAEYIKGTRAEHVATCAKHYPGHGNTSTDSHLQIPIIDKHPISWREKIRTYPFWKASSVGVDAIMAGHIARSATSKNIWSFHVRKLRGAGVYHDWDGIVITDALDMQAIVDAEAAGRFTRKLFQDSHMKRATKRGAFVGDAACCAFYAGVDVLLMPAQPEIAIEMLGYALLRGTKQWRIHLEESLRRIRTLKEFVGLLPAGKPIVGLQPQLFIEHKQLALKIALTACDVASPVDNNLLPLPEHAPLAVFSILQQAEDLQAASRFFTMLGQATENDCDFAYLDETITRAQLGDMAENIDDAELLIFALFYRGRGYSERLGNADTVNEIIRVLSGGRPFIVICFGDHYIADSLDGDTKILTYSDSFASLAAAVAVLVGRGETVLGKS